MKNLSAKVALLFLSFFSLSAFSSELDQPVTNVSDRARLQKDLPATVIVRVALDQNGKETSQAEFLLSDEKIQNENQLENLAAKADFSPLSLESPHELDRAGGVASFYFYYNWGAYYPVFNYYYSYNYSPYYSWANLFYNYYCYRLWW